MLYGPQVPDCVDTPLKGGNPILWESSTQALSTTKWKAIMSQWEETGAAKTHRRGFWHSSTSGCWALGEPCQWRAGRRQQKGSTPEGKLHGRPANESCPPRPLTTEAPLIQLQRLPPGRLPSGLSHGAEQPRAASRRSFRSRHCLQASLHREACEVKFPQLSPVALGRCSPACSQMTLTEENRWMGKKLQFPGATEASRASLWGRLLLHNQQTVFSCASLRGGAAGRV